MGPGPREGEAGGGCTELCSVAGLRELVFGVESENVVGGTSWLSRVIQVCFGLGQTRVTLCAMST